MTEKDFCTRKVAVFQHNGNLVDNIIDQFFFLVNECSVSNSFGGR
jgi:hypothetical protein